MSKKESGRNTILLFKKNNMYNNKNFKKNGNDD